MQKKLTIFFTFLALIYCFKVSAGPWFTGPLLAPAGVTIPLGHMNFEIYGFFTEQTGEYAPDGKKIKTPIFKSAQYYPLLSYGLADKFDVEFAVPYTKNSTEGIKGHHIGDTSIFLGYQALRQKPKSWTPNLRITIQEVIPTGRFDNLNPTDKGAGVTGAGCYQTIGSLNFEDLTQLSDSHYLRTRLSLAYVYAQPTNTTGQNGFGGRLTTRGHIKPGNTVAVDLAGELTLTQNWVAVMEYYFLQHQESTYTALDRNINPITIHHPAYVTTSLAPAIEFNFSENFGIIGGVWFSIQGKNAPVYSSTVIAFNAYW